MRRWPPAVRRVGPDDLLIGEVHRNDPASLDPLADLPRLAGLAASRAALLFELAVLPLTGLTYPMLRDGTAYVQAGAGVVADSDPVAEDTECRNKAAAVLRAVHTANRLGR